MYVVIEGIDTSGKSTQVDLLKCEFKNAIFTKEPGGTSLGESIRKMLLNGEILSTRAELFMFLADRAEHYEEIVKPNRDKFIFSDRGVISGIAYAKTNHEEFSFDKLIELNMIALNKDMPDIIFLLKVDKTLIKKRLSIKENDNIEKRGIEYLLKVQENMQKVLQKMNIKYVEIDASKSIGIIHNMIINNLGK
jgi:dTMP kinase